MKSKFFFPLVLLIALGMIAYSLVPLFVKNNENPKKAFANIGYGYFASGKKLNALIKYDKKLFAASLAPGVANPQTGPRFISKNKSDGNDPNYGVTIILPETVINGLKKKPATSIVVSFEPINIAPPLYVNFNFIGDNNQFQTFKIIDLKTPRNVRFRLDNPMQLNRIVINPAIEGENHGLEIKSIVIEN